MVSEQPDHDPPVTQHDHTPIFDTGAHPITSPHTSVAIDDPLGHGPLSPYPDFDAVPQVMSDPVPVPESGPVSRPVSAQPIAVPSQFVSIARWKFVGFLLGIWVSAAAIGLAMFFRWFHAVDKTWPDFVLLVYVVCCVVAALIVSMADQKPARSALAIGIMSAPFVSGCAAAILYGSYAFGWLTP